MDESKIRDLIKNKLMSDLFDGITDSESKGKTPMDEVMKHMMDLTLIHNASLVRIYGIADKIASNRIQGDLEFVEPKEIPLPDGNEWNFGLGDHVVINYSLPDFISIQRRTLGWVKRLENVHGHSGIVTDTHGKYESGVRVYFPDIFASSTIFAGALEKVEEKSSVPSRWKVGDYVQTKKNKKVVKLMQRKLPDIPKKHVGEKGRVIAVTSAGVFVTFDELTSFAINSGLLHLSADTSPIEIPELTHPRGFKVGTKVHVIKNLKKLIENQKDNGGWNPAMSPLLGKEVTIVIIQQDGSLNVALTNDRNWRLNHESVVEHPDLDTCLVEEDLEFKPNDLVKIKMFDHIRIQFRAEKIRLEFLDYLRTTALVEHVDDDLEVVVRFNCNQKIALNPSSLRRATASEGEYYYSIKKQDKNLKPGDTVYLDVGPPNFIKAVLKKTDKYIIDALTSPSKLLGFIDNDHAVIEYANGSKYKINKKYLTVPEKFNVGTESYDDQFGTESVLELQKTVKMCIEMIHIQEDPVYEESTAKKSEAAVDLYSMSMYPPGVIFKIRSTLASPQNLIEPLRSVSGWKIEEICEGRVYIKGLKTYNDSILMELLFNDEEYNRSSDKSKKESEELYEYEEESSPEMKAPPDDRPGPSGVGQGRPAQPTMPIIERVQDFQLMPLYDRSLARTVYFPYYIHGPARTPLEPPQDMTVLRARDSNFHINTVETLITN